MTAPPRRRGSGRGSRRSRVVVLVVVLGLCAVVGWTWKRGSLVGVPIRPHCTAGALGVSAELEPEQMNNAAIIAGVAVRRELPARAATIAIATARQESKLINVEYGDRDSLGLFQQRPSQGWGTAAQVRDPIHAANAFYDALIKIPGYEGLSITEAAQRVQRSAFPQAYADHESEARVLASALSGYSTGALTCVLRPVARGGAGGGAGGGPASGAGGPARVAALIAAANLDLGRRGTALPGPTPAVHFAMQTPPAKRLSWALAQWAVARADALDVVAVEVDGHQWRRDHPGDGWAALATAPAAGEVVVRLAP